MKPDSALENPGSAPVALTVSALNRAVAGLLSQQMRLVRVRGEIRNMTRAASGHWYFTLKDPSAQVRCVMFRGRNLLVAAAPRDGDAIEVVAQVGLYEARGDYQLTVESLALAGAGRLFEEFLQLRDRLAAEGLFDPARKRALPAVPTAVGVVTSLQAAALRDVLATLARRAPYVRIVIYPVPVQGAGAGARIASAIDSASRRAEVDVLLLVRGGGSIEDLWAFNDEQLARALRASRLAVVVGVGHESDFTIADFAADVRAPTPTAAAELVAPDHADLSAGLVQRMRRLRQWLRHAAQARAQRLDLALRVLAAPHAPLRGLAGRLADLRARCARAARARLERARGQHTGALRALSHLRPATPPLARALAAQRARLCGAAANGLDSRAVRVAALQRALGHLDVGAVLARGYAIVRRAEPAQSAQSAQSAPSGLGPGSGAQAGQPGQPGQLVVRARDLVPGDGLTVQFAEGSCDARVERVE